MSAGHAEHTLGEVLDIQNGYAFDSKKFSATDGVPLIRIRDLRAGCGTETRFTGDYDDKYLVRSGDLLIGMDGEFGCYEWKGTPSLLNQRVCRLQGFASKLLPKYLFYGVNTHLKAIEDVTGYTTVKHLSSKQILGIKFTVPPLPEQQRVVGILDEAFDGIATAKANAEENLQNARALFESHLQSVFTQGGEGWQASSIRQLVADGVLKKPQDGNHGEIHPTRADYVETGIPFVMAADMQNGEVNTLDCRFIAETQARSLRIGFAKSGDVLLSHKGTIGRAAVLQTEHEFVVLTPQVTYYRARDKNKLLNTFLYYCFLSSIFQSELNQIAGGGSTRAYIGITRQLDLKIVFPSVALQRTLAMQLRELAEETQRLESLYQRKLTALEELKKSLLHQAFSGAL